MEAGRIAQAKAIAEAFVIVEDFAADPLQPLACRASKMNHC
jgi:hypothetical protein